MGTRRSFLIARSPLAHQQGRHKARSHDRDQGGDNPRQSPQRILLYLPKPRPPPTYPAPTTRRPRRRHQQDIHFFPGIPALTTTAPARRGDETGNDQSRHFIAHPQPQPYHHHLPSPSYHHHLRHHSAYTLFHPHLRHRHRAYTPSITTATEHIHHTLTPLQEAVAAESHSQKSRRRGTQIRRPTDDDGGPPDHGTHPRSSHRR